MRQLWKRHGLIVDPKHQTWINSHAQVPTVLTLHDRYRIYFADRDDLGKSFLKYVDVSMSSPYEVLSCGESTILEKALPGTFDDSGVMPSCIVNNKDEIWLYYSGWNEKKTVPYHNSIGLAVSSDNGNTFQRKYIGPVMDRDRNNPYLSVTPFILLDDDVWKMWYISGLSWQKIDGKYEPVYAIKYAESMDGVDWKRYDHICIKQNYPLEAFSNPSIIKHNGLYYMWYSCRGSVDFRGGENSYRLGFAISENGYEWERHDSDLIFDGDVSDWENEMHCYPYVINAGNELLMFYNGNGFGRTGIGLMKLDLQEFLEE